MSKTVNEIPVKQQAYNSAQLVKGHSPFQKHFYYSCVPFNPYV